MTTEATQDKLDPVSTLILTVRRMQIELTIKEINEQNHKKILQDKTDQISALETQFYEFRLKTDRSEEILKCALSANEAEIDQLRETLSQKERLISQLLDIGSDNGIDLMSKLQMNLTELINR